MSTPLRVAQWVRVRWWNACAWYAVTLAQALALRGHASFLLAPASTPAARESLARGLATPDLGDLGSTGPWQWIRSERRLRRFMREEGIQLINVHSGPGHARLALFCRRRGIPLVRTRGDIRRPRTGWIQRRLYGVETCHHIVSAEFMRRDYYPDLGVPPSRITLLRGGIDLAQLDRVERPAARWEARARLGLAPDTLLVGMVGRLSPVKGHIHFLNAMARLARENPTFHLVVVGHEAQISYAELREAAVALGIEPRTHLVGWVEDPLSWAAALDVAVIASVDSEAICRSAFEFLGLGVPVVATQVHAIPEVVADGAGILVPPASPERMAEAVGCLLASPELRDAFSRAGRRHMDEHYGLERFGRQAEALFLRLIQNGEESNPKDSRAGPQTGWPEGGLE